MKTAPSLLLASLFALSIATSAQAQPQTVSGYQDKFRQLDEILPTPNTWRNAAGQPGHEYWQQEVDYRIEVTLDEAARRVSASERVTYQNNSPDTLSYLWLQLDQNIFKQNSMAELTDTFGSVPQVETGDGSQPARISLNALRRQQYLDDNEPGFVIESLTDASGTSLPFTVVGTLMRVDLLQPLRPGQSTQFVLDFSFNIVDAGVTGARSGYEHFPDDAREGGNDIFLLAQWFPRLAAYTDYEGWTNKEFLDSGEFTLEFGDYDVEITVPADHIVSATGVLQNPGNVLTREQQARLRNAENAARPVYIVTPEEALENEREGTSESATWRFSADNVRDFAWASSRKFIWDAKGFHQDNPDNPLVMAMSFFPKEGDPLWSEYSTEVVIHTMEVYNRFAFDYPYPVAQSVNGPVGGMEYPMITFNGPRTTLQDDGSRTYSLAEKRFLIVVVIHEIGHIYFPMVVNTDERQWTWMDEGINSFLEAVASREWDPEMPWGVEPRDIVDYMRSSNQQPIMTQSDSVTRLGPNAYSKPATALNILRETIMGRELFDFAFRQYALQWQFKRPTPSDFFRIMEDASGVDLDWFWRGWFYTTDRVDISLDRVYAMRLDTQNPDIDFVRRRDEELAKPESLSVLRNREEGLESWVERNPDVRDFYDDNDQFTVTNVERNAYQSFLDGLDESDRAVLERALAEDKHYYVLQFSNQGGLVMPLILQMTHDDGTAADLYIPAEIWRQNAQQVNKLIVSDKPVTEIALDPRWETADTNMENNYYPRRIIPSRLETFRGQGGGGDLAGRDIMQDIKTELRSRDDNSADNADDNSDENADAGNSTGDAP